VSPFLFDPAVGSRVSPFAAWSSLIRFRQPRRCVAVVARQLEQFGHSVLDAAAQGGLAAFVAYIALLFTRLR